MAILSKTRGCRELRETYEIPSDVSIRIPEPNEGIDGNVLENEVCIFEKALMAGLHLPFSLVVREILHILGMAPTQLKPNGWRNVFACCVAWPMVLGEGVHLFAPEFLNLFAPVKYGHTWTLQARNKRFFSTPSTWGSNPAFRKFLLLCFWARMGTSPYSVGPLTRNSGSSPLEGNNIGEVPKTEINGGPAR
jgi:hypothetical protein